MKISLINVAAPWPPSPGIETSKGCGKGFALPESSGEPCGVSPWQQGGSKATSPHLTGMWALGDLPQSCWPERHNLLEVCSMEGRALGVLIGMVFQGTEKGLREERCMPVFPKYF